TIDTKVAFYRFGCACPTAEPLCCNDDACQLQSSFTCETVCGQQYLIQIGVKPGTPGGTGTFTVTCSGNPCPQESCADCCGKQPNFRTDPVRANFIGPAQVATTEGVNPNDFVVHLIDLNNPQIYASPPQNWFAPFYHHPSWTKANLGTVFGLTLDDQG